MPKANNFDLVRLMAALQVAINHSASHLKIEHTDRALCHLTSLFPGVPVFFFISGFLISKSFENNSVLTEFGVNRFLRIYPGLVCCFLASLAMVWMTGYFHTASASLAEVVGWAVGQLSILQFYNPDFLRAYGVGVLNGSMWTITVELQFYVLVPVLYRLFALPLVSRQRSSWMLLATAFIFLGLNQAYAFGGGRYGEQSWHKLIGVTFVPWFYMFLTGVLFQRHFSTIHSYLTGRLLPVLVIYCVAAWVSNSVMGFRLGNSLNPLLFVALCVVTFAAAFSYTGLSDRLLRRNDLSYGVYIYHMPVVNFLLVMGLGGTTQSLLMAIVSTLVLAFLSWRIVEKPALRMKRHPLYEHGAVRGPNSGHLS
jgi:peptidoglycan/LPS O-acetylase OafA/YrhL